MLSTCITWRIMANNVYMLDSSFVFNNLTSILTWSTMTARDAGICFASFILSHITCCIITNNACINPNRWLLWSWPISTWSWHGGLLLRLRLWPRLGMTFLSRRCVQWLFRRIILSNNVTSARHTRW